MPRGSYDYLFKILLVGGSSVGKSSLTTTFHNKTFQNSPYIPTIGMDFVSHTFQLDGQKVKVQLWDLSPGERYRPLVPACYRGVHGVIIVFDVTDQHSFGNTICNCWIIISCPIFSLILLKNQESIP